MADLNKVMLIGRLTNDLEIKKMGNNTSVVNFTVATNRTYKSQDGTKVEETEFHRCVAFGPIADIMAQYLSKGRKVYIEGRLRTRQWEDQAGNKRYTTEIIVTDFNFCDSPNNGGNSNTQSQQDNLANMQEEEDIPF